MTEVGTRLYAIGDVHGRHDLLIRLLETILNDNRHRAPARIGIILLGDLINRGPTSRQVLELVCSWPSKSTPLIVLRGNHEQALLAAWEGNWMAARQLLRMDVSATLTSYGVNNVDFDTLEPEPLMDLLQNRIPPQHIAFMERMPLLWTSGDYIFAHASFTSGVSLGQQSEKTLLWSRSPFKPHRDDARALVHGHANLDQPINLIQRICVDTSAYRSNTLTAVGLEGTERWFLATT